MEKTIHLEHQYVSKDVIDLEKKYFKETKITHSLNNQYLLDVYELKRKYVNDIHNHKALDNFEKYIKFKDNMLDSAKNTLIALFSFVFLPLGFITGFFGMNFGSMGNPNIRKGILSISYSHIILLFLSIMILFTSFVYFYDIYHSE